MRDLTIEDFSGHVGEDFAVEAGGAGFALTLEEASPLPNSVRKAGSFSLSFRGPPDPVLPQAIYTLRRGDDAFDIFICPNAVDGGGARYEAIFN